MKRAKLVYAFGDGTLSSWSLPSPLQRDPSPSLERPFDANSSETLYFVSWDEWSPALPAQDQSLSGQTPQGKRSFSFLRVAFFPFGLSLFFTTAFFRLGPKTSLKARSPHRGPTRRFRQQRDRSLSLEDAASTRPYYDNFVYRPAPPSECLSDGEIVAEGPNIFPFGETLPGEPGAPKQVSTPQAVASGCNHSPFFTLANSPSSFSKRSHGSLFLMQKLSSRNA